MCEMGAPGLSGHHCTDARHGKTPRHHAGGQGSEPPDPAKGQN
jgi:hypothetical protein